MKLLILNTFLYLIKSILYVKSLKNLFYMCYICKRNDLKLLFFPQFKIIVINLIAKTKIKDFNAIYSMQWKQNFLMVQFFLLPKKFLVPKNNYYRL